MKKSLIALAALAAAGVASAQSSVTLFGVVDAAVTGYSNKSSNDAGGSYTGSRMALTNGAESSSRLGFRGTEDLGGGMAASFWLEASLSNDDGRMGQTIGAPGASNGAADIFNRRSTVSLSGGFGEVRLGRDYTPTFWNDTLFDPYGTVGVGTNLILRGISAAANNPSAANYVRASNSIGYLLPPNLGGVYGQVMYAFGEQDHLPGDSNNGGRYMGGRIGWANGPVNVAAAYAEVLSLRSAAVAAVPAVVLPSTGEIITPGKDAVAAGQSYKTKIFNIAGSYDFGVAKLVAEYSDGKVNTTDNPGMRGWMLGALAPVGAGVIKLSYADVRFRSDGVSSSDRAKANQWALGYVHNLSKRTALYATLARVTNKNGANLSTGGPAYITTNGATGKNSTGYDLGIRHSF